MSVPVRKYSRLFSCASENFGYSQKVVIGGGVGVTAGAKEAPTWERRFCLPSDRRGFAQQVHDVSEPIEEGVKLQCGKNAFFRSCKLCLCR